GADRPLPALLIYEVRLSQTAIRPTGAGHALPLLPVRRYAGEGFAPGRGRRGDPAPSRLPRLRRPLHHLRARAVARPDGGEEIRPQGALRSREARALARYRAEEAQCRA